MITRRVADLLTGMPERHRFLRGMVAWIGGHQIPILYDRDARFAGDTKFSLVRMLRFASAAITGFRAAHFRWRRPRVCWRPDQPCLGIYSVIAWLLGEAVPGWTSLMAAFGFVSGLQFFMLGVFGAYLGRLSEESRGRPLFLEADRAGRGLAATQKALADVIP